MKKVITASQFQALMVLRDEMHFGRAAIRLGIAQPHLSALLRRVEEVAGFRIFERRPVCITPAGAILLRAGAQMLTDVEAGIAEARMVASGKIGLVRLGYSPSEIFASLANAVTHFANSNPLVELRLREGSPPSLYEQYRRGELDMIVTRDDGSTQPSASVRLIQDRIVALLPQNHPAASDVPLSLAQLNDDRFIFIRRSAAPEYVNRIMSAAFEAGLKPARTQEVDSWSAALALVRSGFGVTFATSFYQNFEIPGARFCAIKETLPDVSFHLIFDRDRLSPTSARFVAHLRTCLQTGPENTRDALAAEIWSSKPPLQ